MARKIRTSGANRLRFRLMPITLAFLGVMLGVKLTDAMHSGRALFQAAMVGDVVAEQTEPGKAPADATADKKAEGAAPAEAKKTEGEPKEGESKDAAKPADAPPMPPMDKSKPEFSQIEVDLLQSLSKRREELDKWGDDLKLKENLLSATEMRLNGKIDDIKKLKKEVEILLVQYNEKEDAKIRSLVKIYENMKPKDAAAIFEELDMPVLLLVADRMSERKVAPVLANMSPKKAMQLTTELAEQRKLYQYTQESVNNLDAPEAAENSAPADAAAPPTDASPAGAATKP